MESSTLSLDIASTPPLSDGGENFPEFWIKGRGREIFAIMGRGESSAHYKILNFDGRDF